MGFSSYNQNIKDLLIEIGQKKPIVYTRTEGGCNRNVDMLALSRLSKRSVDYFELVLSNPGTTSTHALYQLADCYANGPKIFNLNKLDFEALENVDLNICVKDYNQPFKTIVINLPEKYMEKRLFNQNDIADCVVITHEKELEILFVTIILKSKELYGFMLADTDITIEQAIKILNTEARNVGNLPVTNDERVSADNICRAILNATLFVDDYGYKKIGPENQSYYDRLVRYNQVAKKQKNKDKIIKTQNEINSHPIVYSFVQEVELYKTHTESSVAEPGEPSKVISPHWRRGHYRMQVYGPYNTLRKRIRIAPILVNKDWFGGCYSQTNYIGSL